MTIESLADVVRSARAKADGRVEPGSDRERLMRAAQEFESMLMLQMLKEMRKAGSWDDEDGEKGYGAETMLETMDAELAGHLSRVQGLGLGKQLLELLGPKAAEGERVETSIASVVRPTVPVGTEGDGHTLAVPPGAVTSAFGWRQDPFHGAARFHRGVDIRAAYGQDVPAAGAGKVITAGTQGGYGQTVVIEHANGMRTRYAHLSATLVAPGDEVTEGQPVGRAGRSGRATGTHLHFEVVSANGEALNPEQFAAFKGERLVADSTRGTNPVWQESRSNDIKD